MYFIWSSGINLSDGLPTTPCWMVKKNVQMNDWYVQDLISSICFSPSASFWRFLFFKPLGKGALAKNRISQHNFKYNLEVTHTVTYTTEKTITSTLTLQSCKIFTSCILFLNFSPLFRKGNIVAQRFQIFNVA